MSDGTQDGEIRKLGRDLSSDPKNEELRKKLARLYEQYVSSMAKRGQNYQELKDMLGWDPRL